MAFCFSKVVDFAETFRMLHWRASGRSSMLFLWLWSDSDLTYLLKEFAWAPPPLSVLQKKKILIQNNGKAHHSLRILNHIGKKTGFKGIAVSGGCSGSNCPLLWLQNLEKAFPQVKFDERFQAEIEPEISFMNFINHYWGQSHYIASADISKYLGCTTNISSHFGLATNI